MENYYYEPKQVVFADPDCPGSWLIGIAYKDEVICACCGGTFEIEDIIENFEGDCDPIWDYEMWNDLSDEIKGGVFPEGFAEATGLDIAMMNADEYESYVYSLNEVESEIEDSDIDEEDEFESYSHFSFDVD